jgi:hypothetical protein
MTPVCWDVQDGRSGTDQLHRRKVLSIRTGIARQETHTRHSGVCPDEEVRKRRASSVASATPALNERTTREEGGRPGKLVAAIRLGRNRGVKIFDPREPCRKFRIDDRVDRNLAAIRRFPKRIGRPPAPSRISRNDVDQDVGVDERAGVRESGHPDERRVRARSSSVLMPLQPRAPARRRTTSAPRLCVSAFSTSIRVPRTRKLSSVPGTMPSAWRTSRGIVTCPLVVTRTELPFRSITDRGNTTVRGAGGHPVQDDPRVRSRRSMNPCVRSRCRTL